MDEVDRGDSSDRPRRSTPPDLRDLVDLRDLADRRVEGTRQRRELDRELRRYLADLETSLVEATIHESRLEEALATRTVIGQTVGLLMAHEGLNSDEAFERLVSVSQNANIKLRDIAARYIEAWEEKVDGGKAT